MKNRFFDRLVKKIDYLDQGSLQSHFLSLAQEKGLMETIFQALEDWHAFAPLQAQHV